MSSVLRFALCATWLSTTLAYGAQSSQNLVWNGDFEVNSVVPCQSNIQNALLNQRLASAVGFGTASQTDVYTSACFGVAAVSGVTKVGLYSSGPSNADAFSLELITPVLAGDELNVAFAAQAVLDFAPNLGSVEIGLSDSPTSFGTLVFTGSLSSAYVWEWFGASFYAPVDAGFITIRASTSGSWVHVDAVSLTVGAPGIFCSGDGSGVACPCANGTAANRGCANSTFAAGARLYATGNAGASVATDSLVLAASDLAGPGLFIQGTSNSAGSAFGDGGLCLTGTLTRLGITFPAGGVGALPNAGAPTPIHAAGGVAVGDVRSYQVWYRDALPYCTPATFNLTEGIVITWGA